MSSPTTKLGSIANRWRELQGESQWDGLLDPLDPDLRASIIAYGELAEATYGAFNTERRSPHAGACVYGHADLLAGTGVSSPGNYAVTKFLYATCGLAAAPLAEAFLLLPSPSLREEPWCRESNWMGFVAVATDQGVAALGRRDIVVAWRGTVRNLEWVNDLDFMPASAAAVLGPAAAAKYPSAIVHHGFLSVYTSSDKDSKYNKASARDQVLEEVRRLVEMYKDEVTSITVTGHSLGASLATLNAVDMVATGVKVALSSSSPSPCPVTGILFASPRVGDSGFKAALASPFFRDLRLLHVRNSGDVVPLYPPIGYVDAAVALPISTSRSPYLRVPGTVVTHHNLECYLHGVAGEQGAAGGFKLEVDRDVALVNKGADALKDEFPVPANWWVPMNRCMVRGADGHWKLHDFEET